MKTLKELQEPFNDAHNYKNRAQKEFFNRVFLRTSALDEILGPSVYFLMGEKGSGKTAYAVYMENNKYGNTTSQVTTMTETQYNKFIQLKRQGHLNYSDYASIWRAILLFVISQMILTKSKGFFSSLTNKYKKIEQSLAAWTANSLNPEIEIAFDVILREAANASIGATQVGKAEASHATERSERTTQIRHNLLNCEREFRDALQSLKLTNNHILFFDGIDYRPDTINYREYLECVKGLGEAVWQLNSEFFGSIRDSKGRIKVVLLVRPDVFHALNLYNSNSRFQDNTVFLNWSTSENDYQTSALFEACGRYFSSQQSETISPRDAWNHYYENGRQDAQIFKKLLRLTFQKPRDYLTFIKLTRRRELDSKRGHLTQFPADCASNASFTKEFSDYLLGEAKNYAAFYMTQEDFSKYIKFFQFLDGRREFTYQTFQDAYDRFKLWANGEKFDATEYLRDASSLLQLFFDMNIIGYYEVSEDLKDRFVHWSYRERSLNNISPKVKADATLLLNQGIMKALDIGTALRDSKQPSQSKRQKSFKRPGRKRRR